MVLWIAAALGFGAAIFKLIGCHRQMGPGLAIVAAIASGLGVISLLVLVLGMCLRPGAVLAWAILLVGWVAGCWAREVWLNPNLRGPQAGLYRWLVLLPLASLGLASVGALVPPGVLWGDEPNGYDVLEYHLQLPREWYELGRIIPLHHNVFSYFPLNVEMHFLLAMALRGGPWSGMYLAQLMHVAFIALTVLAVYALIAERSKPMAIIAATAVATVPWMGLLAPIAYDEGGLLLWGTLAICLVIRAEDDWKTMALAGGLAGLACGSKLTAVPIVLLATPAIHVIFGRFKTKALVGTASYLIAGALLFSPWLMKNVAWIGNPVFPEATTLLGRGDWSPTQVERWIRANHFPRSDQQNFAGRASAAWGQVIGDWRYGFVFLPLTVATVLLGRKRMRCAELVLIVVALAVFWLCFTHLQSRFFTLAIPLCGLLIGACEPRRGQQVACSIIVVLMGLGGLAAVYMKLTSISPGLFDFVGAESLQALTPLADRQIEPDVHVLLVGDGRPFLYRVPTERLLYRTVFDVDAKPGQTGDVAWRAGWPMDDKEIQVMDAPELRRFARTYWGIPLPSDAVQQMREAEVR